jgi:hypothetical protein
MNEEVLLSSFVDQMYLSPLRRLQNTDGGWGFHAGCESRVEPTAWALIALQEFEASSASEDPISRGLTFLETRQLEDGSWAASAGQNEGCWVTSLACWALGLHGQNAPILQRALHWMNEDKPRDAGFWWKLIRKLVNRERVNSQSASLSGWSWTPHTASWVEPTCYALIAQQVAASAPHTDSVNRSELARAMLYDRMCPGGGWNCGNPRVYGVAGQPQVGPTVWALIALREESQRAENCESLAWLERNREKIQSPESLALTNIALKLYGKSSGVTADNTEPFQASSALSWSIQALSWAALARSENSKWLNPQRDRNL